MIEVRDLTHYYGAHRALSDVSLRIEDREIVGFLGLNGAGKSTMLRILAGLQLPSAGTVTIDGVDASASPDLVRRRIGFLPDEPPLHREMRVDEFLRWAGQLKGRTKAEVDEVLPRALEICQIADVSKRLISELSFGYRKRVGIALTIVHRPDLIILDEPIGGLDPVQIVEMRSVVKNLQEHATVLISSHILSEITQTCDRILVLHEGKLVAEGTEQELSDRIGSGGRLVLTLRGDRARIEGVLGGLDGVDGFELEDGHGDGDLVPARVQLSADVREDLVRALVEAGIGVRRLEEGEAELERVFLGLTKDDKGGAKA
jgi:ABC-2 type transport system ATP-binding protein